MMRALAAQCERTGRARVLVLQLEQEWYNLWDRLRDEWVQRMEGTGKGCWVDSFEEEIACQERFLSRRACLFFCRR